MNATALFAHNSQLLASTSPLPHNNSPRLPHNGSDPRGGGAVCARLGAARPAAGQAWLLSRSPRRRLSLAAAPLVPLPPVAHAWLLSPSPQPTEDHCRLARLALPVRLDEELIDMAFLIF